MSYLEYRAFSSRLETKQPSVCSRTCSKFSLLPKDAICTIVTFLAQSDRMRFLCVNRYTRGLIQSGSWGGAVSLADLCSRSDLKALSTFYSSEIGDSAKSFWIRKLSSGGYDHVTSLSLSTCVVTIDEVNCVLTGCPAVVTLDLSFTDVDDRFLSSVNLVGVRNLTLNHCTNPKLQLNGSQVFSKIAQLKSLSLAHCNQITQGHVADVLKRCQQLKSIDLSGCAIGDSLFEITSKTNIEQLHLNETRFTNETLASLLLLCPNLKGLHISRCPFLTDDGVSSQLHDDLVEFSFAGCAGEMCFLKLSSSSSIQWIDASHTPLRGCTLASLLRLSSLLRIDIVGCKGARLDALRSGDIMRIVVENAGKLTSGTKKYFGFRERRGYQKTCQAIHTPTIYM